MFQRVADVYRHFTGRIHQAKRPPVSLGVLPLEERATPTVIAMPAQPPEIVLVAPLAVVPANPAVATASAVRTDLFGAGAASPAPSEWDEMLAADHAEKVEETAAPKAQPQDEANDAVNVVRIDDEYLLPVE